MSSPAVRRAVYSALPVLLPDFLYVPTLNVPVDKTTLPAGPWYTVDFQAFESARVSLGTPGCFLERGVILVSLASPPDLGDLALADMAEAFRTAFIDWFDDSGAIRVREVDPPLEVDAGDLRGSWWLMEVSMDYEYHRH
jgi:hypothetical protein